VTHQTFLKLQVPATAVQAVSVGGSPGFWVSGAPHGFLFYGAAYDTIRLSADTLVWNQGPLVVRLESGLGRDASIRLAQTLQ
jgi:hypothetical protein